MFAVALDIEGPAVDQEPVAADFDGVDAEGLLLAVNQLAVLLQINTGLIEIDVKQLPQAGSGNRDDRFTAAAAANDLTVLIHDHDFNRVNVADHIRYDLHHGFRGSEILVEGDVIYQHDIEHIGFGRCVNADISCQTGVVAVLMYGTFSKHLDDSHALLWGAVEKVLELVLNNEVPSWFLTQHE